MGPSGVYTPAEQECSQKESQLSEKLPVLQCEHPGQWNLWQSEAPAAARRPLRLCHLQALSGGRMEGRGRGGSEQWAPVWPSVSSAVITREMDLLGNLVLVVAQLPTRGT